MIITIDGPAGSGKSSVAKSVAQELNYTFYDTGAMYRAVTYAIIENKIDFHDENALIELLTHFLYSVKTIGDEKYYFIGSENVTDQIRSREVTQHVSKVSAEPIVRELLVSIQHHCAKDTDSVFEGRDMGSVVFPKADLKIFLTASPEIRAERRHRELVEKKTISESKISKEQILKEIIERDNYDSTSEHSPLCQAKDAHAIDTSHLSIPEVVTKILSLLPK